MTLRLHAFIVPLSFAAGLMSLGACGMGNSQSTSTSQNESEPTTSGTTTSTTPTTTTQATPPAPTTGAEGSGVLTVNATGFAPHAGNDFAAVVLDVNNNRVGNANLVVPADGNFTFTISGLSANGNYRLDYYADLNKNGFCNTPPTDHSWSVAVPAGATTMGIEHNETFTTVCGAFGTYNLVFTGTDFQPHAGQTFYIDVVDQQDATEVGEVKQMTIPTNGVVGATYDGLLLPGHSYTVAYFADVNKNMECDDNGVDHAWTKTEADVSANVALAGKHDDAQVKNVCVNFPTGVLP